MKITCIGVGNMGGSVARRLAVSTDFQVTVFDPSIEAVEACEAAGASRATTLETAATEADVVLTSLPTTDLVIDTVRNILPVIPKSCVILDISTVDPSTAITALNLAQSAERIFLSCPLGKTPSHAENGEIPLFIGGDQEAITKLKPLLDRMGEKTYNFATVEAATAFKVVSNLIGMANVAILAEGLAVALNAGIAPEVFREALADTGGSSFQSEVRLPWMMERDWQPRFGVNLAAKDVRLAVEFAQKRQIPVPVGSAALSQLLDAANRGFGNEDVVALMKLTGMSAESRNA